MAKKKVFAVKFTKVDIGRTKNRKGHTRTGACPSRGKCYHGWRARPGK